LITLEEGLQPGRDASRVGLVSLVPRVALRCPDEAAAALGISPDFFDQHIRPDLKLIRRGRLVLVSVAELTGWIARSECRVFDS
jgi:hypothetical protein